MIKKILVYILSIVLEHLKKELTNDLLNIDEAIQKDKERLENKFQANLLNHKKNKEAIHKVLGLIDNKVDLDGGY